MLTSSRPSLSNNSALAEGTRVALSAGFLVAADGATDELGTIESRVLATDQVAVVLPLNTPGIRHFIAAGAIAAGVEVYAAAAGQVAATGTLLRGVSMEAASGAGAMFRVFVSQASLIGDLARANLVEDLAQPYTIPLTSLQAPGTGAQLGSAAGTPAGALGLTVGTFGTHTPLLVGEAANGNSKTDAGRFQFALPVEYVPGGNVKVRVHANVTGLVQVAETIAVAAYKSDKAGGVSANLVTAAATAITATFADYDFVLTPTGLVQGDLLDIQITAVANDTGGTANKLVQIGAVQVMLDVQG